jgi:glycine/D-amino acid oxidase-like deaminating enzyme
MSLVAPGRSPAMAIVPTDLSRPDSPHVGSYWAATAGEEVAGAEPVSTDLEAEVAIIGGGYTGLSTAYHLARDFGIIAHVLEANRIAWGCSGRNGGFCLTSIGKEDHGAWIRRWGIERARAIAAQGREAVQTVAGLIAAEGIDAEPTPAGGLELAHRPSRFKAMAARQRQLRELGLETTLLSKAELERSRIVSREAHGALLHAEGFGLHPLRYARGLARAAQRQGARLHSGSPVTAWGRDGDRHLLTTPGGRVRARQVVVATNGYTSDLLHPHLAGRLLPALSSIIVTRPLTDAEREATGWQTSLTIYDSRHLLFYFRLLPDGRVLFGARGGIHDTPGGNQRSKAWLQRRMAAMFPPLVRVEVEFFWRGWVCLSADRNPHVGTADDPTVHYALAYMGSGVALATLSGRYLARRIGGDLGVDFGPLLAAPLPRFPLPALRRLYQRAAYLWYRIEDEWL